MIRFIVALSTIAAAVAFSPMKLPKTTTTKLFAEPTLTQVLRRDLQTLDPYFPEGFEAEQIEEFVEHSDEEMKEIQKAYISREARDKRLAKTDPARYCADRCLTTGHCEVFEDIFEMSAEDVRKFCEDCVTSEAQDSCDVPESLLSKLP